MAEKPLECAKCPRDLSVLLVEIGLSFISKTVMCSHCPALPKTWSLKEAGPDKSRASMQCPECDTVLDDVKQGLSMGCAHCYSVFFDFLQGSDLLGGRSIHIGRSPGITGKSPSLCGELSVLNEKLKTLILLEDYEEAAKVRDLIREILGTEG